MRRSLQALLSVGLLALVCAAGASAAQGSSARPQIQCRAGAPPPCCVGVTAGPGIVPCCVPTTQGCPGLTISSSRDPSRADRAVKITGRLMPAASSGIAVTLWQELPGQTAFHAVALTSTDSTGAYAFTRRAGSVKTNRSWYVTANGTRSLTLAQMVEATVSLSVSSKRNGAGERTTFKGRVSPSHGGEHVRIEERVANGWSVIATIRLTRASTYTLRLSSPGSATAVVRAALGADSKNVASYSRTVHTTL